MKTALRKVELNSVEKKSCHQTLLGESQILLVEDGPDNQRLICFILQSLGADVITLNNGQEAIDWLKNSTNSLPDLILMDMQMPVVDGYEATRQLRKTGLKTPILALTAHALPEEIDRCLNAGCNRFASKPIDRDQFITDICELIEESNLVAT